MTETTTAEQSADEIATTEQEAREADDLLAALEERVRDGDEKVTPQQLTEQRELGRFARLRAEAARRKADRAVQKAEEQRKAGMRREAVDLLAADADTVTLRAAYDKTRDSLAELGRLVQRHDDAVGRATGLLKAAGSPQCEGVPEDMAGPPATPDAPRWSTGIGRATVTFGKGNGARHACGFAPFLAELLSEAPDLPDRAELLCKPVERLAHPYEQGVIRRYLDQPTKNGK